MKKIIFLFVFIQGTLLFSQDLSKYISVNSEYVVTFNHSSLLNKYNAESLVKEFEKNANIDWEYSIDLAQFISYTLGKSYKTTGVSNKSNSYYAYSESDSINQYLCVIPLSSSKKFEQHIKSVYKGTITKYNKLNQIIAGKSALFWDDKKAIIIDYSIPWRYDYYYAGEEAVAEDDEYYETYEQREEARRQKEKLKNIKNLHSIIDNTLAFDENISIKNNSEYKKASSQKFDINVFFGSHLYYNSMFNQYPFRSIFRGVDESALARVLKDNYGYYNVNFEKALIDIEAVGVSNDYLLQDYIDMNNAKLNKEILKYIKGKDILGYSSFAVNPKAVSKVYKKIITPLFDDTEESQRTQIANEYIGIFEVFFDQDEFYDWIKGDGIIALTNIREFERKYVSYEYDDDFNETQVTKVKKEILPEFIAAVSMGNEKLVNHFIRIMEIAEVVVKLDNGFYYAKEMSEDGIDIYFKHHNGILFITNDDQFINNKVHENGLPKAEQLSSEHIKFINQNNFAGYWDTKKTLNLIPVEEMMSKSEQEMLKLIESKADYIKYYGSENKGNKFTAKMEVKMNSSKNSLQELIDIAVTLIQKDSEY